MRTSFLRLILVAAAMSSLALSAETASAACTRLGFSVNDYGKDGPTKDAKALLDKYIAKWAAEKGIAKYTTGKKDVTCELFLNFIVFDEHTCRAEATVCWDGSMPKGGVDKTAADPAAKQPSKAAKASTGDSTEKSSAATQDTKQAEKKEKAEAKPVETGSTTKSAPAEEAPAEAQSTGDPDPSSPNYGGSNPAH